MAPKSHDTPKKAPTKARASSGSGNRLSKKFKGRTNTPTQTGTPIKVKGNSITFYHLANKNFKNPEAPSCLVIRGNGYMERAISEPMYKRNKDKNYETFVENVAPYPLVVNPVDEKGEFVLRPNKNKKRKEDPDFYREKCIVIECPPGAKWDPDFKEFFNDTLKPNLEMLQKTEIFRTFPTIVTTDPPCYNVPFWSSMLATPAILDILKTFYVNGEDSDYDKLEDYLKSSKDVVYSCWPVGKVPIEDVIMQFNLGEEHLDTTDFKAYTAALQILVDTADEEEDCSNKNLTGELDNESEGEPES